MNDPAFPSPLLLPGSGGWPLLLSVAHAGREYPAALVALARGGRAALEGLADPLVDQLVWRARDLGHGAVIARTPRAAVDCNRGEDELDPRAVEGVGPAGGPRASHGLGLVPSRLGGAALWRRAIHRDELEQRLDAAYRPFHAAIAGQLAAVRATHGAALLIDCHSMPAQPGGRPQLVIGDRQGSSCAPELARLALDIGRRRGFSTAHNDPFAGGEIVRRHGRPIEGVHAIQVEIDRACYLTRDGRRPGPGFDRVAMLFEALAEGLGRWTAASAGLAEAAE